MPTLPPHPPSPRQQRDAARDDTPRRRAPPAAPVNDADRAEPPPRASGLSSLLRSDGRRTALLFALAFVVACVLYWPAMDAKISLPYALHGAPLVLPLLVALADAWASGRPFSRSLWVGASVLPATVFARVVHDGLKDPTSRNLWPFEVAIAIGVSLPAALAGAALGWLVLRASRRRRADEG